MITTYENEKWGKVCTSNPNRRRTKSKIKETEIGNGLSAHRNTKTLHAAVF